MIRRRMGMRPKISKCVRTVNSRKAASFMARLTTGKGDASQWEDQMIRRRMGMRPKISKCVRTVNSRNGFKKKENSWSFNPRQDVCFGMNQSDCSKAEGCKFYGKAYGGKGGCVTVGGPNDPKAGKDAAQKAQVRSDRQFAERLQKKENPWSFSAGVHFGSNQDECKGMEQS